MFDTYNDAKVWFENSGFFECVSINRENELVEILYREAKDIGHAEIICEHFVEEQLK